MLNHFVMEKKQIDIENMIERLNRNKNIASIRLENLEEWDLTEEEKSFIKKHEPERALIIYGSLAPNKPNHSEVEHIKGRWMNAIVRGKLEQEGWGTEMGYLGFRPTAIEQQAIKAIVLFSDELGDNWNRLDEFEGEEYRRILAKYELENGDVGVGYIYAIDE